MISANVTEVQRKRRKMGQGSRLRRVCFDGKRVSIVWRVNGVNKDLEVEIRVECSGNTN